MFFHRASKDVSSGTQKVSRELANRIAPLKPPSSNLDIPCPPMCLAQNA